MILISPHAPEKVVEILRREIDPPPSFLRVLLPLNGHYYRGTSAVCGVVHDSSFELMNRSGPGLSARVRGRLAATESGTEIRLAFARPKIPDLIGWVLDRYASDRERVVRFLEAQLDARELGAAQATKP
jgi:hypothetical protein